MDAKDKAAIDEWLRNDEFTLANAAALIVGCVPQPEIHKASKAWAPTFQFLFRSAIDGDLKTNPSPVGLMGIGYDPQSAGLAAVAKKSDLIHLLETSRRPLGLLEASNVDEKERRSEGQELRRAKERIDYLEFALACLLTEPNDSRPTNAAALSRLVEDQGSKWPEDRTKMPKPDTGAKFISEALKIFKR